MATAENRQLPDGIVSYAAWGDQVLTLDMSCVRAVSKFDQERTEVLLGDGGGWQALNERYDKVLNDWCDYLRSVEPAKQE